MRGYTFHMRRIFWLALCFLVPLILPSVIFAKTKVASPSAIIVKVAIASSSATVVTATPSAQTISPVGSSTLKAQGDALKEKYRQQLDQYRNDARLYVIAREQYYQLTTLAAQEDAVQATQKVMLSRLAVLETYVKLLSVTLEDTPGIDITQKATQQGYLATLAAVLQAHQKQVELANDRPSINTVVNSFTNVESQTENSAYITLGMINYGRIQATYDKTVSVKDEIKADVQQNETDALVQASKMRGVEEIERELSAVDTQLAKARLDVSKMQTGTDAAFTYQNVQTELENIYAALSRSLSLLDEVVKPGSS